MSSVPLRSSIVTEPFRGTPGAYVRRCTLMWLGRWWWALALPVAVCAALALSEPVWLFVAMMVLFLLIPAIIAFVYFRYGLSPEAVQTLLERTVSVDGRAITVTDTGSGKTHRYAPTDIHSVEDTGKTLVIRLVHPRYHHIAVPLSAVPEGERNVFVQMTMALVGKTEMA